jgi:hypothetical protein
MTMTSRRSRRWTLLLPGLTLLGGASAGCAVFSRDVQDAPPAVSGRLWRARLGDTTLVVYLTREERSKTIRGSSEDYSRHDPYVRYELAVRRVPDGSMATSSRLADVPRTANADEPSIIGVVGDVIWLWNKGIEARNLSDLSVRATMATLAGTGPESAADVLPKEPKGYAILAEPLTLVARGRDARFYAIDADAGAVRQIDPSAFPPNTSSTRLEDRFDYLVPPGQSRPFTSPVEYPAAKLSDVRWQMVRADVGVRARRRVEMAKRRATSLRRRGEIALPHNVRAR